MTLEKIKMSFPKNLSFHFYLHNECVIACVMMWEGEKHEKTCTAYSSFVALTQALKVFDNLTKEEYQHLMDLSERII